jgi:hypothetical protein
MMIYKKLLHCVNYMILLESPGLLFDKLLVTVKLNM